MPTAYGGAGGVAGGGAPGEGNLTGMVLQLSSREGGGGGGQVASSSSSSLGLPGGGMFPLALSLEQGKGGVYGKAEDVGSGGRRYRDEQAAAAVAAEAGRPPSAKAVSRAVRRADPHRVGTAFPYTIFAPEGSRNAIMSFRNPRTKSSRRRKGTWVSFRITVGVICHIAGCGCGGRGGTRADASEALLTWK